MLVVADTALQGGIAQWYDNTLYVCSLGQGISAKVFRSWGEFERTTDGFDLISAT